MGKRRGRGEASIFQLPDGRWRAVVSLGFDVEGKRLRKVKEARSKTAVLQWLQDFKSRDIQALAETSTITVGKYLNTWLEDSVRPHRKPKTHKCYSDTVRLYIMPHIGGIQLAKLAPLHCTQLAAKLEKEGKSRRVRQLAKAVLHRALEQAIELELVTRNAAHKMPAPTGVGKSEKFWTAEQARTFLDHPSVFNHRLYALFELALRTGARQAELLGLSPDSTDSAGTMRIHRQLLEMFTKGEGTKFTLEDLKSKASKREIKLGEASLRAIRLHKAQRLQEGFAAAPYLFVNSNGEPIKKSHLDRTFKALCMSAGVPVIRFHDLRHTCATLLLRGGISPKVVQALLGHSDIVITLGTYSHVLPEMVSEASQKLEEVLK